MVARGPALCRRRLAVAGAVARPDDDGRPLLPAGVAGQLGSARPCHGHARTRIDGRQLQDADQLPRGSGLERGSHRSPRLGQRPAHRPHGRLLPGRRRELPTRPPVQPGRDRDGQREDQLCGRRDTDLLALHRRRRRQRQPLPGDAASAASAAQAQRIPALPLAPGPGAADGLGAHPLITGLLRRHLPGPVCRDRPVRADDPGQLGQAAVVQTASRGRPRRRPPRPGIRRKTGPDLVAGPHQRRRPHAARAW